MMKDMMTMNIFEKMIVGKNPQHEQFKKMILCCFLFSKWECLIWVGTCSNVTCFKGGCRFICSKVVGVSIWTCLLNPFMEKRRMVP